ncbi:hypothetical protein ACFYVL_43970 [Streptomyces sp. NPDC004111]|uniref:hypothetical protein n=1 Tax=Streptomyces sp. NPDC004111 TaxID=3364690 RepID=UPI0036C081FE
MPGLVSLTTDGLIDHCPATPGDTVALITASSGTHRTLTVPATAEGIVAHVQDDGDASPLASALLGEPIRGHVLFSGPSVALLHDDMYRFLSLEDAMLLATLLMDAADATGATVTAMSSTGVATYGG